MNKILNPNHFDEIDNYDEEIPAHVANYLLEVKNRKILISLERYFNAEHRKNNNLKGIDLGCGTGGYINYLQQLNSALTIDGLDYSEKQVNHAKRKGLKNTFIHASMSNITGVQDETYDFSYAINSIHHLPSKNEQIKTFDEVFRILKPGGIFIVHEINIKNPLIGFYMNHIFPRIRNIDDGSEIWLSEKLVRESNFVVEEIDYFTFVPDFTPLFLMGTMVMFDKFLSKSLLSIFGAHVMYVLRKPNIYIFSL